MVEDDRTVRPESLHGHDAPWWALVEFNADAIVLVDDEGRVRLANAAAETLFGRPRDDLQGTDFGFPLGGAGAQELDVIRLDGSRVTAEMRCIRMAWQGRFMWLSTLRDVSERRQTENRLRRSEAHLTEAQRLAAVGSWVYDARREALVCSEQAGRILGQDGAGDLSLAAMLDRVHPEDRDAVAAALNLALAEEASCDCECRVRASGEERVVHLRGEVMADEFGRSTQVVGAIQDVTERIQAENRRMQAERSRNLADRLQALGRMAGGTAHELNNVLAPMVGLSSLILQDLAADSPIRETVAEIRDAGHRARDMLRRLLSFSHLAGQEDEIILLNSAIQEALGSCRRILPPTVAVEVEVPEPPMFVRCTGENIDRVMVHLMTNARDALAGRDGARVEVRLRRRTVTAEPPPPGDYAELLFADNGCGIDEATARHIFDPFFTTKEVGEGSGMGLSEVYGLIAGLGGHLSVDSRPGRGTTLRILCPLLEPDAVEAALRLREDGEGTG